jgi:branched-chain amino acid transport system substrate-binding protein
VKSGGDTWFLISADYVFGQTRQRDTATIVTKLGGKVLGSIAYPFPEITEFSTHLIRAQASGAKVLGLAMAGVDTEIFIKQAHEFGLNNSMTNAALLIQVRGVRALGLDTAQGLRWSESYYWDLNDRTQSWDVAKVITTTPMEEAWRPLSEGGCPLVQR